MKLTTLKQANLSNDRFCYFFYTNDVGETKKTMIEVLGTSHIEGYLTCFQNGVSALYDERLQVYVEEVA